MLLKGIDMKSTGKLKIISNFIQPETILIIHPNEGYDLDLMNNSYSVKIFTNTTIEDFNTENGDFIIGEIKLDNNCPHGSLQVSRKYHKKNGNFQQAQIFFDQNKILISTCS